MWKNKFYHILHLILSVKGNSYMVIKKKYIKN